MCPWICHSLCVSQAGIYSISPLVWFPLRLSANDRADAVQTWLGEELTGKYYARLPELSLVERRVRLIGVVAAYFLRAVHS